MTLTTLAALMLLNIPTKANAKTEYEYKNVCAESSIIARYMAEVETGHSWSLDEWTGSTCGYTKDGYLKYVYRLFRIL